MKSTSILSCFSAIILIIYFLLCSGCGTDDPGEGKVRDADGNIYQTVVIGTQVWMASDLKTSCLNDETPIAHLTDNDEWKGSTAPAYCWHGNGYSTYKDIYGMLYNWHAVETGKLCPTGWHVPSPAEWHTLNTTLGGETVAGGKLKETGTSLWEEPNTGATNESGFGARPGGLRSFTCSGSFSNIRKYGYWWSSSQSSDIDAWIRSLDYSNGNFYVGNYNKRNGCSVRCLKD